MCSRAARLVRPTGLNLDLKYSLQINSPIAIKSKLRFSHSSNTLHKKPFSMATPTSSSGAASGAPQYGDKLPKDLVDAMQGIFGKHPGYRTTHAKGLLVEGTFTPTAEAKTLSIAPHFNNASTPVVARFSVGGGLPHVADVADGATPKGIAIRFQIDKDTHTDLISHSFNGFAARTGEDFLAFLKVFGAQGVAARLLEKAKAAGGDTTKEQQIFDQANAAFGVFLKGHAPAMKFVTSSKPNPHNYGTITYYEPNTHILTNKDGKTTNVRYRLDPTDGEQLYPNVTPQDKENLQKLGQSYLEDDLKQRFPGKPIVLTIQAHIAGPNDTLDDATIPYTSTNFIPIGKLEINKVSDDNAAKQQQIAFSPTPEKGGIKGIKSSSDPLIQARKGVYWISADQRRHEKQTDSNHALDTANRQADISVTRFVLQKGGKTLSRRSNTYGYRHDLDREIKPAMYKKKIRKAGIDKLGGFKSSRAGPISAIKNTHPAVFGCDLLIADTATDTNDQGFIAKERRLLNTKQHNTTPAKTPFTTNMMQFTITRLLLQQRSDAKSRAAYAYRTRVGTDQSTCRLLHFNTYWKSSRSRQKDRPRSLLAANPPGWP
ncbi:hypothetical protein AK830_g5153 [Neonectria ditissima]|uniref:Catalase core domain-containing protein n=1 Tax=Neonectria ditissima TaxID=78410 RepID=A0A0P7BEW6_9HYPO|nr:hypothetical protein AK830_g5153 [Neonectria ditissima]